MQAFLRAAGYLLILTLITACQAPSPAQVLPLATVTAAPRTVRLGLTEGAGSLPSLTSEPFTRFMPWVRIQFVVANNATLFADLTAGELDAILVHVIPPEAEVWFNPVALDGLVILVAPENQIQGLARPQLQALFNGRIRDWADLGGSSRPISLATRERGSGARTLLRQRVLLEQPLAITARVESTPAGMIDFVMTDPGAVGYAMFNNHGPARPLAIDGIGPTVATMANQTYPLATPLYFVALREPDGEARAFLAWLQSEAGQTILSARFGRVR